MKGKKMAYDHNDSLGSITPDKKFQEETGPLTFTDLIYNATKDDLHLIPRVPGLYVLLSGGKIYCGEAENLNRRIRESIRKQGFGTVILYVTQNLIVDLNQEIHQQLWKSLETDVIRALITICLYNKIRIGITNQRKVRALPPEAWEDEENSPYRVPIRIAQTALYMSGVPISPPRRVNAHEYLRRLWLIRPLKSEDEIYRLKIIWEPRVASPLTQLFLKNFRKRD